MRLVTRRVKSPLPVGKSVLRKAKPFISPVTRGRLPAFQLSVMERGMEAMVQFRLSPPRTSVALKVFAGDLAMANAGLHDTASAAEMGKARSLCGMRASIPGELLRLT